MKLPKKTENTTSRAPLDVSRHGRWYNDACGTAFALELLGERWALLVVRELMFGARRFSDLRAALPGISAKVLTERLIALEASHVVMRQPLPLPGKGQAYGLTTWGLAAEPLIQELGRWAARSGAHNPRLPLSAVSLMLSLRTMLDPAKCERVAGRIGFAIGDEHFIAKPCGRELPICRAELAGADAVYRAPDAAALAAGIYGGVPWEDLEQTEAVVISGDRTLALQFVQLFSLPSPLA